MPINLDAPLAWETANADERAMLDDLQGNILDGHGRRATRHIFLRFNAGKEAKARGFLADLAGTLLTSAHKQLKEAKLFREQGIAGGPFLGILLSSAGYEALNVSAKAPQPADDDAFKDGMVHRRDSLNDPDTADLEAPYRDRLHAMILIGADPDGDESWDSTAAETVETQVLNKMQDCATVVTTEIGRAIFRDNGKDVTGASKIEGIEHFGYVDGRSQPLMLQELIDRERDSTDGINNWSPIFPLRQVLVPDPGSPAPGTAFGSFFVFRKLKQDVAGFKALEETLGKDASLGALGELMGATLVGRFEDGTPVTLFKSDGANAPVPNNFNYDDDVEGLKCPFHAHIRKTNPRGDVVRTFPGAPPDADRRPIMARRGMPFGRRDKVTDPDGLLPGVDVGLMFMSFQANLRDQFEFTQQSWANNPGFVNAGGGSAGFPETGRDPVIGQKGADASVKLTHRTEWGAPKTPTQQITFEGFVRHMGGEYFFAPAKSTLLSL